MCKVCSFVARIRGKNGGIEVLTAGLLTSECLEKQDLLMWPSSKLLLVHYWP